ncbi:MAG TPA: tyrosine-type recombinase/integrase [Geminicoccus sp.]|jgi:integrase|uniref:tyrosine-type recombinase/integrase n=1 Tax=Geminicoccus sp. TaxID=2024832 RepID=UPI002E34D706|nr:tyrosine-type recombinase/integrase [Geminicoccus sp.]HEX2528526.1 tyrosine-type recombinase/integrase [Geminicoccus sp.]
MPKPIPLTRISSKTERAKLETAHEPWWFGVAPGQHLGYRRLKGSDYGTWYARWRPTGGNGGSYRKTTLGFADDQREANGIDILSFAQARASAIKWWDQLARKAAGLEEEAPPTVRTVGDALDDYLRWFRRSQKSVTEARRAIERHIRPALGQTDMNRLTTARLRNWHHALAEAPALGRSGKPKALATAIEPEELQRRRQSTANRLLTTLKAALTHAHREHGVGDPSIWTRVQAFKSVEAARLRYLSRDEVIRLLNACPPDFRRLVRAAVETGCRFGELARARVRDVDVTARTLLVPVAKSGRARHVPLDRAASAFLQTLVQGRGGDELLLLRFDGQAWGDNHQIARMRLASQRAGIVPAVNFHALRHTYASGRIMAGAPLLVVAQALGHTDTRMVERHYGHLAPGFVRQTIDETGFALDAEPTNVAPLKPEATAVA